MMADPAFGCAKWNAVPEGHVLQFSDIMMCSLLLWVGCLGADLINMIIASQAAKQMQRSKQASKLEAGKDAIILFIPFKLSCTPHNQCFTSAKGLEM